MAWKTIIETSEEKIDRLTEENEALKAERDSVMEWEPIETAPRNDKSDYFSCIAAWGPDDDKCTGYAMRYKDKWFSGAVFYRSGGHDQRQYEFREIEIEPTHWMADPEEPETGRLTPQLISHKKWGKHQH